MFKRISLMSVIVALLASLWVVAAQSAVQINTFSSSTTSINAGELANRTIRLPVEWDVAHRPAGSNLVFDQILPDGRVMNVELLRSNLFVASKGTGVVAPFPPGDAAKDVVLRLRVVASDGGVLAEQRLTLEIATPTPAPPPTTAPATEATAEPTLGPLAIQTFSSSASAIIRSALADKTARIPVTFAVQNRPANSNLVFEQILPDGSAVNVELPRQNPLVPSSGAGIVAPVNPPATATSLTLRLRVVDLAAPSNTLAQQDLSISIQEATPVPGVAIAVFKLGVANVERPALMDGSARIPVEWAVKNRPAGSSIVFEQVLDDGRVVNVELPRSNPFVAAAGQGVVAPVMPGAAGTAVNLQLRVVGADESELAKHTLTLPITATASTVKIVSFSAATTDGLPLASLQDKSARLQINWQVTGRPANSNLIFEQVLADGKAVNVELPRREAIIPASATSGVVAPVDPGAALNVVLLRLRVVDVASNTTLANSQLSVPISGRSSAPTTATPIPTSAASTGGPVINNFAISSATVQRGGNITLSWDVTGATSIQIFRLAEFGDGVLEKVIDTGTAVGTFAYTVPADTINSASFELSASSADQRESRATTSVAIDCPYETTLLDSCPITQSLLLVAFQPFERGYMLWNGATREIYVLLDDGTWSKYADTYQDGESSPTDVAPTGLFTPQFGFGKLWTQLGKSASALGWATAPEIGTETAWETHPFVVEGNIVGAPVVRLPDARILKLFLPWEMD